MRSGAALGRRGSSRASAAGRSVMAGHPAATVAPGGARHVAFGEPARATPATNSGGRAGSAARGPGLAGADGGAGEGGGAATRVRAPDGASAAATAGGGAATAGSGPTGVGGSAGPTADELAARVAAAAADPIDVWNPPKLLPAPSAARAPRPEHKLTCGDQWQADPLEGETFEQFQQRRAAGARQHPLYQTSGFNAPLSDAYLRANASTEGKRSRFSEYVMRGSLTASNRAYNITTGVPKSRYHKKLDGILGVGW